MSSRSDRFSDEVISQFLRSRSADPEPGLLDDIVRGISATTQDRPWLGLGPFPLPRPTLLIVAAGLLLAMAGAIGIGSLLLRPDLLVTPLPTTPDAWERVLIETPQGSGSVASVVAGPQGLLAVIQGGDRQGAGDGPTRLATSSDGRTWTLVPEEQHPPLGDTRGFGPPSVVGTDQGFLLVQSGAVWTSADGSDWRRLAGTSTDPDLSMGGPRVVAVGGPGLVAVGGDTAWYSEDGSDWSLAAVPPLPAEILARPDEERYVDMRGITAAGGELVAWGIAEVPLPGAGDEHLVLPLVWASHDGRTWTDVADPSMTSVNTVAGGPAGFIAAGQLGPEPAAWFSADGQAWERIVGDAFESRWPAGPNGLRLNGDPGDIPVELRLASAAAAGAGYLVVGVDGFCGSSEGFCGSDEAVIWTSVDGRSWTRVPNDGRFEGGHAKASTAWGSRFVVGGEIDGMPAVWTSHP